MGSIPGPMSVTTRHDGGERYDGGMLKLGGYVYKGRGNVVFATATLTSFPASTSAGWPTRAGRGRRATQGGG